MGRKSKVKSIEAKFGKPLQQILQELFAQGDIRFVAGKLEISPGSVINYSRQFGVYSHRTQTVTNNLQDSELKQAIENFLITKQVGGKTKSTIEFYSNNLRRFLWWLEQEGIPGKVSILTPVIIRKFLYYVQTSSERFGGLSTTSRRPVSRSTVDAYWRTFQSLSKWMLMEEIIKESFIAKVERPGQVKTIIPDVPSNVIKSILNSLDDDFLGIRNRAILYVLIDTGIRLNELLGMKHTDILPDNLIKVFGKGQKERIVRISPTTAKVFTSYLTLCPNKNEWIWVSENGKHMTRSGVQSIFRQLAKLNPGVKINPHAFRHTFAIDYLRAGGDPYTLQMLGGWTDLDMPRQYAAALKQEDAFKVHEKASPIEFLLNEHAKEDN